MAFRPARVDCEDGASRPERSRPFDFLGAAVLEVVFLVGSEASSSARRAALSAFFFASAAALADAASLIVGVSTCSLGA